MLLGEPLLSASSSLNSSGAIPQASSSLADSASSIYSDFVDATSESLHFRCRAWSACPVRAAACTAAHVACATMQDAGVRQGVLCLPHLASEQVLEPG